MAKFESHFLSISSRPGPFGVNVYNKIFSDLSLPYHYRSLKLSSEDQVSQLLSLCQTSDLCKGISISMPYKSCALKFLPFTCLDLDDRSSGLLSSTGLVNTVVFDNPKAKCYLTDIAILDEFYQTFDSQIKYLHIYGTGAMSKLSKAYFSNLNYKIIDYRRSDFSLFTKRLLFGASSCAYINATPRDLSRLFLELSSSAPILDLPVRYFDFNTDRLPRLFTGTLATIHQFRFQFHSYTGILLDIDYILQVCRGLFPHGF